MRRSFGGFSTVILLSACSNSGSDVANSSNMVAESLTTESLVAENLVESAPPPAPPPRHRYAFKEGDLYGYLGAISEEEQKRGVASPPVVRYRYTGFWQGAQHLQLMDDSGSVVLSQECAVPCVVIKQTDYKGQVRRIGYSSDSINGAAFDDAMKGYLRRSPTPGAISGGYRFRGGNPGDSANWDPILPPTAPAEAEPHPGEVENVSVETPKAENTF